MKKILNVLIIEDHPMVIEGYQRVFEEISSVDRNFKFNIASALCCETANFKINEYTISNSIDIVLLDLRLPASKDGKTISGEDVGYKIRDEFPNCKIIIITSLSDNYILNTILKKLNPDGLIIKSEISGRELKDAIFSVLDDKPYYSISVLRLLRKQISSDFVVEPVDRQILYHLSIGTKTKDLPKIVHLSLGGVERRKRQLKQIFNVDETNDNVLLKIAKDNGFI
ncbi:response regulator [Gelidibacter sp. F63206]|uniref:response regulator n=1 Tax=Gelidibacter sp. F63206 TaxID=2926425 RepID=UPI001FF2AC22|nr:response regulator [Gelidibacter sp. F63206]MCK0115035.1 response regulator [Gelidibacter sp. F63206]